MTILHIITSSVSWAGMEQYAYDLSKGLIDRGHRHLFVVANDGDKAYPRFEKLGKVYLLPLKSKFDIPSILALRKILKAEKPDIIHTHQPKNIFHAYFAQDSKKSIPIVHTIHFNIGRTSPHNLYSWILNRPAAIIPVSEQARQCAIKVYPNVHPDKFHTILNSIDSDRLSQHDVAEKQNDPVVLGYAGRLVDYKGIEVLLHAASRLKEQGISFKLVVAGKGDDLYEEKLSVMVRDLNIKNHVEFLGFVKDVGGFIANIDIAVAPAIWIETCSLMLLEYMSKGKAIVTSDHGGQPEVIDNNVEGILIPHSDPILLAEKLAHLIQDKAFRESLGRAAKERFDNKLSFASFLDHTFSLYERVVKRRTRS